MLTRPGALMIGKALQVDVSILEIVRTYMVHMVRAYIILYCNWLILLTKRTLRVIG